MKKIFSNECGIVISNDDPERRGRVKIFIPHVMPALYKGWNQAGEDISIQTLGSNALQGLSPDLIERLNKILPWAECAAPVLGACSTTNYSQGTNNQTGYFRTPTNQTISPSQFRDSALPFLSNYESVSQNGYEVTHYGQPNDSTPDSNSLNWKGVQDLLLVPGVSLALSRSARADIEANTGRTIVPGDAIYAYAADGSKSFIGLYHDQSPQPNKNIDLFDPFESLAKTNQFRKHISGVKFVAGDVSEQTKTKWSAEGVAALKSSTTKNFADAQAQPDPSAIVPQPSPNKGSLNLNPELQNVEQMQVATTTGSSQFSFKNATGSTYLSSAKGATLCGVGTRKIAGYLTGNESWQQSGWGNANEMDDKANFLEGGLYGKTSNVQADMSYQAQQGDILIHNKGMGKYGHAQIYVDGAWHSYTANDGGPERYFNKSGQSSTLYRLTEKGQDAVRQRGLCDTSQLGTPFQGTYAGDSRTPGSKENNAQVDQNIDASGTKHVTETFAVAQDTTGLPQGAFSVPKPGAMLWVFFRGGDPLFPVYFAASYGSNEWSAAYNTASPDTEYPGDRRTETAIRNKTIIANGGGIELSGTNELDASNPVESMDQNKKDLRGVKAFAPSGAYTHWHAGGITQYSPGEEFKQIAGDAHKICKNREDFTYGDNNNITIGDHFTIVGKVSKESIEAVEAQIKLIKEIHQS